MKKYKTCKQNYTTEELIVMDMNNIHQIKEMTISLTKALDIDGDCHCPEEITCLIYDKYTVMLENIEYLIAAFDENCYQCSPYRVYSQLLEISAYLQRSLGVLDFMMQDYYQDYVSFCSLIHMLRQLILTADVIFRYLQNIQKEYCCIASC